MKIKYIFPVIASIFFSVSAFSQAQLYFEDFEGTTNTFTLNDTIYGKNGGNNKWIVNNIYTAGPGYGITMSEDSTYGGTISYTTLPTYGHYLHIYDSASGYVNDNYNPSDSSNRFAHMTTGICTKALDNVNFNFFYLCQGSATAYGEVYYSVDGGPWILTGSLLNNRYKWQYATITNNAFSNVEDLRFGFLWHNNSASGSDTSALGIDDVSLYGTYDSINFPIKCTFTTAYYDSCLGQDAGIEVLANLSDSTCNSEWDFEVSNGSGNFTNPVVVYTYYVGPSYYNDITPYFYAEIPNTYVTPGRCYEVRATRLTYPYLTFTDTVCFPLDTCPGYITTLQPAATLDTNPVCAGSVIDVPFFSEGVYDTYNTYFCQLIDSIGHTAKIDTIGTLSSNIAYPYPPGDIVSTIPFSVPAGCKYYLRVVCNTGNRPGSIWGPFCIQHCDIVTDSNASQVLLACLASCTKQPKGWTDSIIFDVHKYDSLAKYYNGNEFQVQLIQFMNYPPSFTALPPSGLLGVLVDTTNGKMYIHVPCPDTLFAHGIDPGVYYIRIIADSSSFPDSSFGTLIHLTIGEPNDTMFLSLATAGPYCAGSTITVYTNPDDEYAPYNSTYQWWITDKRNGTLPFNNYPYGELSFYDNGGDTVLITCQENNYGCLGPKVTLPDTIVILGEPNVTKKGPSYLCIGDTGTFSIPFANTTDYIWTLPASAHADTANNVLKIEFDSAGTFSFTVLAINACFSQSATWTIKVIAKPAPVITADPPGAFCVGIVDTLSVSGASTYKWSTGKTTTTIKVTPTSDTTYWVAASNKGCSINDTIIIKVLPLPIVAASPSVTAVCAGDTAALKASGAHSYSWSPTTGLVGSNTDSVIEVVVTGAETYTVIGKGSDGCSDTASASVTPLPTTGALLTSATIIPEGTTITLSATGGTSYYWTPPGGLSCDSCPNPVAFPSVTTTYTVSIKDSNGCRLSDTVTVEVKNACTIFVPEAFTPDNPHGDNLILYVRSECILNLDFMVFDRWGNKVFESTNINEGWDGTYKGERMNAATFVYLVTGTKTNGETFSIKGNVALIR